MNCFKDKYIEQLFADERFSPIRQKLKMLETAEQLAAIVAGGQKYPFEFVCYKITGYRPQTQVQPHLIDGDALLSDLSSFVMAMSRTISQPVQMVEQKVYTIPQAAEKIGVSTKTIERWRQNGLISRSMIFENGKRRVAILESSLNSFINNNKDIVEKCAKFSRLDNFETSQIAAIALDTAQTHPDWSRQRLIREVAKKTGRAVETVRYTLVKNFSSGLKTDAALTPQQTADIYAEYRAGASVKQLTNRYNRSRSSIYRIINQHKTKHLSALDIEYIDSEDFRSPQAVKEILKEQDIPDINVFDGYMDNLYGNINKLKDTPVLTRDRELALFRLYNCLKYQAKNLCSQAKASGTGRGITKAQTLLKRAEKIKNILVCSNLRLVLSIAKKHTNRGAAFSDLISEGSMALMKAVEGYNYKKGFRFATYASWAIVRSFAPLVSDNNVTVDDEILQMQPDTRQENLDAATAIEEAGHSLQKVMEQNLDEREIYIIRNHYGLDGSLIRRNRKSMKDIGNDLGISAERVRQVELVALQKLRRCLSSDTFDALLK